MRDGGTTDGSRMFALVSYLCQSPVSWYTSGPAQKFILRQIKAIDVTHEEVASQMGDISLTNKPVVGTAEERKLDVCLLMLYGHILFTSTSYTYALGMFDRILDFRGFGLTAASQATS
jgi:general transcription factor 3C polypeptide 3 (transcription factor C subunit 4)